MKEKHFVKELKTKFSQYCLWGKCKDCSRVVSGRGIHDIEVYQVFECLEEYECEQCDGDGYVKTTCPSCDGSGEVEEKCLDCKGKGIIPDEFGEKKLIKKEYQLAKKVV